MTNIDIQAVLGNTEQPGKTKRKITAVGWVQLKPSTQEGDGLFQGLRVLGRLTIEEEVENQPVMIELQ